jgi:hypothetical protein
MLLLMRGTRRFRKVEAWTVNSDGVELAVHRLGLGGDLVISLRWRGGVWEAIHEWNGTEWHGIVWHGLL